MRDAKDSDEARPRYRNGHAGTEDPETLDTSSISLTLRPADFGDAQRDAVHAEPQVDVRSSPSHLGRPSLKRRELIELAGNPFVIDSLDSHTDGQPQYRRDIYPAYDETGRRIGLDHVRNAGTVSESNMGYYRRHVHEYDSIRGTPLPLSSQMPIQSKYPEQGPLPPVSAVIAGIPSDSEYGVGNLSHVQNMPRTPHELLGLAPGLPLNLWSLANPEPPDAKPQYNYHVLVKLAILGNKGQKATLQDILRAIRLRFPYYSSLPKQDAIAFGNSIRHLLSLLAAFVREPKPVTEPGKGSYWRVDFSKGEGNKRVRKRNKPQKRVSDEQESDRQDRQEDGERRDNRSESNESRVSVSTSTTSNDVLDKSPIFQSPIDLRPQTPKPRGGRKPAPKNLITTPNGGTAEIPIPSAEESQNGFRKDSNPAPIIESATRSRKSLTSEPYSQLFPSNVGAQRGHITRGMARKEPYPPPLSTPTSASSNDSRSRSSSERECQRMTVSRDDARFNAPNVSPTDEVAAFREQRDDQRTFVTSHQNCDNNAYAQQHSLNNVARHDSISPRDTYSPKKSPLAPYATKSSNLPSNTVRCSEYVSPISASHEMPSPPASTAYHASSSSAPSSSGGIYGQD